MPSPRISLAIIGAGLGLAVLGSIATTPAGAAPPVDFARDIRPILASRCNACHGAKRQDGGLRLDVRRRAFLGGDAGPAVIARKSGESELIRRIISTDPKHRMPLGAPALPAREAALLEAWIDQGAAWPDALAGKESFSEHWSFRPVRRPPVPTVKAAARVRNPIDGFILARLEARKLTLSPEADPITLIRRLHLDLTGLPPKPEEVDAFVEECAREAQSRSEHQTPNTEHPRTGSRTPNTQHPTPAPPGAYDRLVDRLLASPHFGERWGRHWLDLARFGESDGYENDQLRPHAWRYRDWVVDALNRDLPYDQFTIQQLAGDLLVAEGLRQRAGQLGGALPAELTSPAIASGFHRNTLWNSAASADKEEFRTYAVKDRTDTTGAVWMGLTVGCAKCHTHKYDPITQEEYYRLYAFFDATDNEDVAVPGGPAMSLKAVSRDSYVHLRGSFLQHGPKVTPGAPAFLPPLQPRAQTADRLDLARWLVRPDHPLTSRVAVNRIWQHLFGQGLVPTPENYGLSGQPPTHPELLDWLADSFAGGTGAAGGGHGEMGKRGASGGGNGEMGKRGNAGKLTSVSAFSHLPIASPGTPWSTKRLIRLIVTSAAYRQASDYRPEVAKLDPTNALLSRQNRLRVEAEIVRDLSLSASGLLEAKLGGPSIVPPFPAGLLEQRFTNEALKMPGPDRHRRGIYI
ncbi:MAG: hypothetical protein K0Q72_1573, partial [Armatimonadetes bacterium]|nr:hypothetical protein [Armatimonadota bacterium]